jgi:predicted NBD/HSP70 family sugar kinase
VSFFRVYAGVVVAVGECPEPADPAATAPARAVTAGYQPSLGLKLALAAMVVSVAPAPPGTHPATGAPINLRKLGRVRVLRALSEDGSLSRAELVQLTGLARASVGSVIFDLTDAGLVRETAEAAATSPKMGRPPQLLSLVPTAAYALGVDIGHDHVRTVLTDLVGTPCWDRSDRLDVDNSPGPALEAATELIDRAIAETGVPPDKILGLGMGIACPVDDGHGELAAEGIMPGWVGVRPAGELASRTGLDVRVINDANACVLAERRFGAARESGDILYLRLSSGIGAGVVCGGRMLLGHNGLAGELGHVSVDPDGAVCRCGNRGCLETVASPTAIAALLARSWGRPVSDTDLADLLRSGDRGTLRAVEDAGEAVGRVLAPAVLLLNPELIVVGGELAAVGEALFEPMRRALARSIMSSHARALRIVAGALGDSAGVRGAAALVLDGAPERLSLYPQPASK